MVILGESKINGDKTVSECREDRKIKKGIVNFNIERNKLFIGDLQKLAFDFSGIVSLQNVGGIPLLYLCFLRYR